MNNEVKKLDYSFTFPYNGSLKCKAFSLLDLCGLKEILSSNVSQRKTDCEMMPSYKFGHIYSKTENLFAFIFYPYDKNLLNKKEKVFLSFLYL